MKGSKLVRLLNTLDKLEKIKFKKWLRSPLATNHSDLRHLMDYLMSRRVFTDRNLHKEKVFIAVYGAQKYEDAKLRHLMSLGVSLLEEFVRNFLINNRPNYTEINQANWYKERQLPKLAQQQLRRTTASLAASSTRDEQYFYESMLLEEAKFSLQGRNERLGGNNLEAIHQYRTLFFVIATLKYACIGASHQNLKQTDYSVPMLNNILAQVEEGQYAEQVGVQLYYNAYKMLKSVEEAELYFLALKQLLFESNQAVSEKDYRVLFLYAINYCIKRLNSGDTAYIRESFEWYKMGLARSILIENGSLSPFTYKNQVALGLRLGEFEWVATFIEDYSHYLIPEYRRVYIPYCRARLLFAKGDYPAAMQLLSTVEFDDVFMNLDARVMLLKIYWEIQELEPLDALLNSFTSYVRRQKLLGYHKQNYEHIIRYAKSMLQLPSYDKNKKIALIEAIEKAKPLTEKQWFLDKLL